jgi:hypothetical protein
MLYADNRICSGKGDTIFAIVFLKGQCQEMFQMITSQMQSFGANVIIWDEMVSLG